LPDGTVLAQPVATATLLGTFADAWRVAPAESLLNIGSQTETVQAGIGNTETGLSEMGFLSATANAANDQISAAGNGEILTSSAAAGLLSQADILGVTFHGTLSALSSDIITNFGPKDSIDITDLGGGRLTVLGPVSAAGLLPVAFGGKSADLFFGGGLSGKTFAAISDGHGGTLIGCV